MLLVATVMTGSVHAADTMSVNSRLNYGNYNGYCEDYARGMVWISNDGSNYYSEQVTVGAHETKTDVQVRGALNTCGTSMDPRKENKVFAGNVKSKTSALSISGTEFYRGSVPSGATNTWSSKGSFLNAKLNTSGVATCRGIAEVRTGTVEVQIYRRLIWEKIEYDGRVWRDAGGDGTETIQVKVLRSCPDVLQPKVTINGGDLISRANIDTSTSSVGGRTYGSWGEYGVIAKGSINGMASGGAYSGGATSSGCALYLLTFGSSKGSSCPDSARGKYTSIHASPAARLTALLKGQPRQKTIGSTATIDALDATTVYVAKGDVTITAATPLPKSKWVVIIADTHNVRIESDITYQDGPFNSVGDIPQLVIIARNITIKDTVGRVDSWLVANDSVITCDASGVNEPKELTKNVCNRKLTVNGPVMTKSLKLYRTFASRTAPGVGQPAEAFNLRADAYLWAASLIPVTSRGVTTVHTIDLPPRF